MTQLTAEYPSLVQKKDKGHHFSISFFKSSENSKEVFAISEGTSGLVSLIDIYKTHMARFKGKGKAHPVIIIIDNDSGAEEICKKLKIKKLTEPFYHIDQNLYLLPISLGIGGEDRAIEDLFEKKILEWKIDGKTFNRCEKINTKTEYGKIVFAEKVVKANQNSISFQEFKPVLTAILGVLDHYKCM